MIPEYRRCVCLLQEPLAFQHIVLMTQCSAPSSLEPSQPSATRTKPLIELPPCPDSALLGAAQPPSSAPLIVEDTVTIQESLPETNTAPLPATLAKDANCVSLRDADQASSWQRQSRATSACPPEPDLHTGLCEDDSNQWIHAPPHSRRMHPDGNPRPTYGGGATDCEPAQPDFLPEAQPVDQGLDDAWEFELSEDEAAVCRPVERGCRSKGRKCAPARARSPGAARGACQPWPEKEEECDREEADFSARGEDCDADADAEPSKSQEVATQLTKTRRPPAKRTKPAVGAKCVTIVKFIRRLVMPATYDPFDVPSRSFIPEI